jgi:hypothetical protein
LGALHRLHFRDWKQRLHVAPEKVGDGRVRRAGLVPFCVLFFQTTLRVARAACDRHLTGAVAGGISLPEAARPVACIEFAYQLVDPAVVTPLALASSDEASRSIASLASGMPG